MKNRVAQLFLRLSLAAGFLSAVADRFGVWGAPGDPNVAWGTWVAFVEYVGVLNPLVPTDLLPALAWLATIAESGLAIGLLVGWNTKWMALGSGALLLTFALAMTFSLGIKAPLDYSVFPAASAALLLHLVSPGTGRFRA